MTFLIPTDRDGFIETSGLVKALDRGILSVEGPDVLEGEEFILDEKRLIESPESEILETTVETITGFLSWQPVKVVNGIR